MELKIVIFIAAFCVANASVIIDKGYEEPETQIGQALEDYIASDQIAQDSSTDDLDSKLISKDRICNRLCRILRFESGSWNNRRCRCTKRDAVANPERTIVEYIGAEESDVILNQDEEIEDSSTDTVDSTLDNPEKLISKDRICNRLCRVLRFESGSWDSRRCRCIKRDAVANPERTIDVYIGAEESDVILNQDEEIEDSSTDTVDSTLDNPEKLISKDRICNRLCRILRFESGSWNNRRCRCIKKDAVANPERTIDVYTGAEESDVILNQEEGIEDSLIDTVDATLDNPDKLISKDRICNRLCRVLRFESGSWNNRRCRCIKRDAVANPERTIDGYNGAEEFNMIANEEVNTPDVDVMDTKSCIASQCNQRCRQLGYTRGVCRNQRCYCQRVKDAEETVSDFSDSTMEVPNSRPPVCNDRACDRLCKRLRFEGGTCNDGKCKCFKKAAVNIPETLNPEGSLQQTEFNESEDFDDEAIELQERCKRIECNINCIRSGYKGGRCWRKECRCF